MKRKADGEDEGDDVDEEDEAEENQDHRSEESVQPKKKKHCVMSSAVVDSGEESERSTIYVQKSKPKRRATDEEVDKNVMPVIPGWPLYESLSACNRCEEGGWKCWSFIRRPRGRQRHSCVHCYLRKVKCNFTTEWAEGLVLRRQAENGDEWMDEDTELAKSKERRIRYRRRAKENENRGVEEGDGDERPKVAKDKRKGKSKNQPDKGKGKEKGKGKGKEEKEKGKEKGKGKGKGKEKGKGKGKVMEMETETEVSGYGVKTEENDGLIWTTSKYQF
jgi:hypothetical protein